MNNNLIYGIGINDSTTKITNKGKMVQFYQTWKNMLQRCSPYSQYKERNISYEEVTCCDEWLTYSLFKGWMEKQEWKGRELDKDLLMHGNKIYSPSTCCFVPKEINTSLTSKQKKKGLYPIGVYYHKRDGVFYAQCGGKYCGSYDKQEDAHRAWQKQKLEEAILLLITYENDENISNGMNRIVCKLSEDLLNNYETVSF